MDKLQVRILRFPTYQAESPWVLQDFSVFQNFDKDKILDGISSDLVFAKACVSDRCSLQRPYSCCSSSFSRSCCSSYLLLLVLVLAVCAGAACEEHTPWSTHWKNSKGSKVSFNSDIYLRFLHLPPTIKLKHTVAWHTQLCQGLGLSACKQTGWINSILHVTRMLESMVRVGRSLLKFPKECREAQCWSILQWQCIFSFSWFCE